MAFCIQDCVNFDDSFTDSDEEYEDDVWSDDESCSSDSDHSVRPQDTTLSRLQPSQLATYKSIYATRSNFYQISLGECQVCFQNLYLVCRPCCKFVLCKNCFQLYITEKVLLGRSEIQCPNMCNYLIDPRDIVDLLPSKCKKKYYALQRAEMQMSLSKSCSHCGNPISSKALLDCEKSKIVCSCCGLVLCYLCLLPWHQGVPCRQSKTEDKLLKVWAKGSLPGQPKAQKCPKCKIYIERITGCDHMNCVKCGTSFCYRCGEAFRSWRAFGDHSSKLSVFGCKYAFLPQKPFCRKLIRGSIFSTRVCAAVIVGTLAIGVGSAAVCVSAAALPFYGAIRLCQKLKRKRRSSIPESVGPTTSPTNCYLIRKIPNISEETEQKGKYLKHPDLTSLNSQAHDQINVSTFCLDSAFPPTTKDVNDWISQMKNVQRIPHPGIEAKGMATNESKDKDLEQKTESTVKTELELSQA